MPSYNLNNVFQYFLTVILPAMLWCWDFTLCQKFGTSHLSQKLQSHDIQNLILILHHLSYQLFYLNLPIWKSVFIFKKEKKKKKYGQRYSWPVVKPLIHHPLLLLISFTGSCGWVKSYSGQGIINIATIIR